MRSQKCHRTVTTGLARDLCNIHSGLAERILRFLSLRSDVVFENVLTDPFVEKKLSLLARHERADLVPHHRLKVMSKTGNSEDVLKLRRETCIRISSVRIVLLRFVCRLCCEKRRIVRALAVYEGNESVISELFLAAVGDRDLRRAFHRYLALVRLERVRGQALNQSAALDSSNSNAPPVHRKGFCKACSKCV